MGLNEKVFGPDGEFDSCPGETPRPDVVVPLSGCHYEFEGRTFDFDPAGMDWTNREPELVLVVGTEDDVCDPWQSQDATEVLQAAGYDARLVEVEGGNHSNVVFYEVVDGEWLPVPDDPIGEEVVQITLDAIQGATP
jgi:acetyl esterase/lipase